MARVGLDLESERQRLGSADYYPRMGLTYLHEIDGSRRLRYGIWNRPQIDTTEPQTYHVTRACDVGRLDNLSTEFYGDPRYWWAIATVNQIKNQFTDMEPGLTLLIPRKDAIVTAISAASRRVFA